MNNNSTYSFDSIDDAPTEYVDKKLFKIVNKPMTSEEILDWCKEQRQILNGVVAQPDRATDF